MATANGKKIGLDKARKRGRPPGKVSTRNDIAVKVDRSIYTQAKAVADYIGSTVAEVLSETARKPLANAYARMIRDAEAKGGVQP
jgi:hypothetical protein